MTHPEASGPSWAPGYGHVTAERAPIAFRFRQEHEDFCVDELPLEAAQPVDSEGSHLWFRIEKRGLGTMEAVSRLARALEKAPRELGFAGRKDSKAVTRQWLSVEHVEPAVLEALEWPDLRVLEVGRQNRKLRLGGLAGNRFELVLRGVSAQAAEEISAGLQLLAERGVPNYYGEQRFGRGGRTWELGLALVQRDAEGYVRARVSEVHAQPGEAQAELARVVEGGSRSEFRTLSALAPRLDGELGALAKQLARRPRHWEWAVRTVPKRVRAFHVSALQSRLFNHLLSLRLPDLQRVLPGDLLVPTWPRLPEPGEDPRGFQLRPVGLEESESPLELGQHVPSGPLPGHGSRLAEGRPGEWEREVLEWASLSLDSFADLGHGLAPRGARRPLVVPLRGLETGPGPVEDSLRVAFELPPGSFATTVLEELRKEHAGT